MLEINWRESSFPKADVALFLFDCVVDSQLALWHYYCHCIGCDGYYCYCSGHYYYLDRMCCDYYCYDYARYELPYVMLLQLVASLWMMNNP